MATPEQLVFASITEVTDADIAASVGNLRDKGEKYSTGPVIALLHANPGFLHELLRELDRRSEADGLVGEAKKVYADGAIDGLGLLIGALLQHAKTATDPLILQEASQSIVPDQIEPAA